MKSIRKITSGLLALVITLSAIFGGSVVLPIGGLSTANVHAEEGGASSVRAIEISPSSVRMTLDPGENRSYSFRITNRGSSRHTFTVSASPYQVSDQDYTPVFEGAESAPRTQIARWIKFDSGSYTLDPDESAEVVFTIDVPSDAMGGGQYAAVFVSADTGTSSTINSVGRVGLLVYATIRGDVFEQGEVVKHSISPLVFDRNISINASVKNTGNTDLVARHTMVVKSFFNGREVTDPIPRAFAVLPETTRTIEIEWENTPALGLFRVMGVVDASYVEKADEQLGTWTQTVLVMPLFLFIILAIILVIVVMMIVLKIMQAVSRRRAKK